MSDKEMHINQAAQYIAAQSPDTGAREALRELWKDLPGQTQYVGQDTIRKKIRKKQNKRRYPSEIKQDSQN